MDLERNLIDNILECEIKLGHASLPVSFYYPCRSLLELLQCKEEQLPAAIKIFQQKQQGRLGDVVIEELVSEKGRYVITVPASGVDWVSTNYQPSEFMKLFVAEITNPNNDLQDILKVFQRFSANIEVKEISEEEWAVRFCDSSIDPYVYHIERNFFGLEYHRFTQEAYENLI